MKNGILQCIAALPALLFPLSAFSAPAQQEVSYRNDVRPIIHDYCLSCHEPGGKGYEKSKLDMRTYQSLMKGTRFGTIIKPGDSFTSIIVQVVEGRVHASIKMPYGMNGGLSRENIGMLKKWIDQGAKDN